MELTRTTITRRAVMGAAIGAGVACSMGSRVARAADDDLPEVTAPVLKPSDDLGEIQRFAPPTMRSTGPRLIFIDDPEGIDEQVPLPSVLYRDTSVGWTRVMTHQQNQLDDPVVVETTVTNISAEPVDLWQRHRGVGISTYPAVAGQLSSRDFVSGPAGVTKVATLQPGEIWRDGDTVDPMITKSALWDLRTSRVGAPESDVPVLYGAVVATPGATVDPVAAPIAPAGKHVRATFEHADRSSMIKVDLRRGNQQIAFNGPGDPESPWYDPDQAIDGQYVLGADAVDGDRPALNNGNYAALYDLRIALTAEAQTPPTGIWIRPSGGAGNHVNVVNDFVNVSPYVRPEQAWLIGVVDDPLHDPRQRILLNLTGGSSGAQQLIFTPGITE